MTQFCIFILYFLNILSKFQLPSIKGVGMGGRSWGSNQLIKFKKYIYIFQSNLIMHCTRESNHFSIFPHFPVFFVSPCIVMPFPLLSCNIQVFLYTLVFSCIWLYFPKFICFTLCAPFFPEKSCGLLCFYVFSYNLLNFPIFPCASIYRILYLSVE